MRVKFFYDKGRYKPVLENPKIMNVRTIKKQNGVIKKNNGASLIDIGDGVALLEFTSPNNAIGLDIITNDSSLQSMKQKQIIKVLSLETQGETFAWGLI